MNRPVPCLLAALSLAVAGLFAACSGEDGGREATPPVPVTESPAAAEVTAAPSEGTPTAPAEESPAAAESPAACPPGGRQFIYSTEARTTSSGSRVWPTRRIVAFDVDTGTRCPLLEYGGVGAYPVREVLRREHLFYATQKRIVRTATDGSGPQEIFRVAGSGGVQDFDVSLDERLLALTLSPADVLLLEVATGDELLRVSGTDARLSGFIGYPWTVHWRDDGLGVVVSGGTDSESPGGLATVMLDGGVAVHEVEGFVNIAVDGRRVAEGPGAICPMLISGHELRLRDLDSGAILAAVSDESKAFTGWAWSPPGDELLYQARDWDGGCGEEVAWHLLSAAGSAPVPDLDRLFARWYGPRLVELACPDQTDPAVALPDRWAEPRAECYGPGHQIGELRLAGQKVDEVHDVVVLGFRGL